MTRTSAACVAVIAALALAGCGSLTGGDEQGARATRSEAAATPEGSTHTMPDGSVMSGDSHADHEDDAGAAGHDHDHGDGGSGPSAAAEMVCAGQVVDDVVRIMDLSRTVQPTPTWDAPTFTCTFDLDEGPLVLTVHDAEQQDAGMAHFQQLRIGTRGAAPIKGVASLGLPAFRTEEVVAFVRDGKTLEVDASGLRGQDLGVEESMSRGEIAYAVAASVLACWTEHS